MRPVVIRPGFLLCAPLVVTMATVLIGCGGSDSESPPGAATPLRARFEERSTFPPDTEWKRHGAFDWEAMHGFFSEQDLFDLTVEETRDIIQIGSRCYARRDGQRWQVSAPAELDNMLCDPQFLNPRREVELLRAGSSEWTEVGSTDIYGVETTRYVAHFHIGAINEKVELWIDDTGLPHRIVHEDRTGDPDGRYRVVREYFDFGRPVEVSAPSG